MNSEYRDSKKQKYEALTLKEFDAKAREFGDEILLIQPYIPVDPEEKGEIGYCIILETENVKWESGLKRKFLKSLNIGELKEENFLDDLVVDLAQYLTRKGYRVHPNKHQYLTRNPKNVMDEDEDIEVIFKMALGEA
ncbi:MAG TPA: hypothetical protein VJ343_00290 [archaeon]|nr:hypothetical protein [archaeon]